jgi:two-component system KDP operon response regulator KdpE
MRGKRILIVDDELELRFLVREVFLRAGAEVFLAADGYEGLRMVAEVRPHLVLLDVMMPDMDGWETGQRMRQLSDVPIIFLSAAGRESDILRGFDCGAVDYVVKPFSPRELLARARVALRQGDVGARREEQTSYDDGYLAIALSPYSVQVQGQPVSLTTTEARLLAFLFQNADRVVTYSEILEHVWGREYRDSPEYVHVYVCHLRRKLEPDPSQAKYIVTEHGTGYRFVGQPPSS